jgi:oxaloacetate decarboxylase alpha subunit/pyruvate carboxylase subunit B
MLNVKFGRWKNFSPQAMQIALGYYGQTPAPVDSEVRAIAAKISGDEPIDCRPADIIDPRMPQLREELRAKGFPNDDEHCVIHAMFPQELEKYYKEKNQPKVAAEPAAPAPKAAAAPVREIAGAGNVREMLLTINGQRTSVTVEEIG